jgi:hypothetical protein
MKTFYVDIHVTRCLTFEVQAESEEAAEAEAARLYEAKEEPKHDDSVGSEICNVEETG